MKKSIKSYRKVSFILLLSLISLYSFSQNLIRVKFKPEYANQLNRTGNTIQQKTRSGYILTNITELDRITIRYRGLEMKRLYRHAGKFENRHRKFGLDLWYEIKLDNPTSKEYKNCISALSNLDGVYMAESVKEKKLIDLKSSVIEPDFTPNDPSYNQQWHYNNTSQTGGLAGADISLEEAWEIQTGNNDVIVAITDGGIDYTHEDLADAMWVNIAEATGTPGVDDDYNGYIDDLHGYGFCDNTGNFLPDPDGHGTHVAGTVGAINNNGIGVSGVAGGTGSGDGVRIMSCAVFGSTGSAGGFEEAYVYAADMGAVINQNSWGYTMSGYYEQSVLDAIDYFIAHAGKNESGIQTGQLNGGLVIFAAGNSNSSSLHYPGCYDSVIAVAATNHNDQKSWYSNYGTWVDIAAPGGETAITQEGVLSTLPYNNYGFYQGTSMACPHVSGVAALLVSEYGGMGTTPNVIRELLLQNTDSIDAQNPSYIGLLGTGRLNAFKALGAPDSIPPGNISDLDIIETGDIYVNLSWTATGGSDTIGKASFYDLRYSEEEITADNFEFAEKAYIPIRPSNYGEIENFTLGGISSSTNYFFALKAHDPYGNSSEISNVITTTTLDAPEIVLSDTSLSITLDNNNSILDSIIIGNTGLEELLYSIDTVKSTFHCQHIFSQDSGSLGIDEQIKLIIEFQALELSPDNYTETLVLNTNDPLKPEVYIIIHVHINGTPEISCFPAHTEFGDVFITDTTFEYIVIQNTGTDSLIIDDIVSVNDAFFTKGFSSYKLYQNDSVFIPVYFAPSSDISYYDSLRVNSNDSEEPVSYIRFSGRGILPPVISVSPDSFDIALFTGDTLIRELIIDNSAGGYDLIYDISVCDCTSVNYVHKSLLNIQSTGTNNNQIQISNDINSSLYEVGDIDSLPDSPAQLACFAINPATDIIYAQENNGTSFYQYNIKTHTWNSLSPSPLYCDNNGGAVHLNGKIYTSYCTSSHMGEYDIATNSWQTKTNSVATGNITSDGEYIYLAIGTTLYKYDVASETLITLSTSAPISFSEWGGLEYVNNKIYGHNGNGSSSFAVYDLETNNWTVLANVPGGAILGSTYNKKTNKYYTYGSYSGRNLYEYDTETNTWTTHFIPNFIVNDGGLAYSSASNKAGVYFIQGQSGTGFAKLETQSFSDIIILPVSSGIINAGEDTTLNIKFSAIDLLGGIYKHMIKINSNDPVNSVVDILSTITVTGIPITDLNSDSLYFPTTYVGYSSRSEIGLSNIGTDTLFIDSVLFSSPFFIIDSFPDYLHPEESAWSTILFNSPSEGSSTDTIYIYNNSHDSVIKATLYTESLIAPNMNVSPDSFDIYLFTGDTLIRTIAIDNITGGSSLNVDITITNDSAGLNKEILLPNPISPNIHMLNQKGNEVLYSISEETEIDGIKVQQDYDGLSSLSNELNGYIVALLSARSQFSYELQLKGAQVYNITSVNPELLDTIDVLLIDDGFVSDAVDLVHNWIYDGGNLIIDGDDILSIYNNLLSGSGIQYLDENCISGLTTNMGDHELLDSITEYYIGSSSLASLSVSDSANTLITDNYAHIYSAMGRLGKGNIIAFGNESLSTNYLNNIALGINAVRWFYSNKSSGWISLDTAAFTLAPTESMDVQVKFDANNLYGGMYYRTIQVHSNDSAKKELNIPVRLNVTGVPLILTDSTVLSFDTTFVGFSRTTELSISNIGTDTLHIDSVIFNTPEIFCKDTIPDYLLPEEMIDVALTYKPKISGTYTFEMKIYNNTKDSIYTIDLITQAILPPEISVSPDSFDIHLCSGDSLTRVLTIDNMAGGSDLKYSIELASGSVDHISDIFGDNEQEDIQKNEQVTNTNIKPENIITSIVRKPQKVVQSNYSSGLEDILESLQSEYPAILEHIPDYYLFSGGNSGNYISDGGNDMYDGGNFLNTNISNNIFYSDALIANHQAFGSEGKYFTIKVPGLFILAADMNDVNSFNISGDLGADGSGYVQAAELSINLLGKKYLGFVKKVHSAYDPSVNHLIIVPESSDEISHTISTNTYSDFDEITGINNCDRIYYILFAGTNGYNYDWSVFNQVMNTFLSITEKNSWLNIESDYSGKVPAGESKDISIKFNASQMNTGDYYQNIVLTNNDSLNPEIHIPAHLQVTGYPEIITDTSLNFDGAFVGYTTHKTIYIENAGYDTLKIDTIYSINPDIELSKNSMDILTGKSDSILVYYNPTEIYSNIDTLVFHYNSKSGDDYIIFMSLQAVEPPEINVNPDAIALRMAPETTCSQYIKINNLGNSNLSYEMTFDSTTSLENILQKLDASYHNITDILPEHYNFSEGESSYNIVNGGENMFNYGNYLETSYGGYIQYSDKHIQNSSLLGDGGQYFTAKFPGLFIFAADVNNLSTFRTTGNLGNNGVGSVDGRNFEFRQKNKYYKAYTKRVYNSSTPSVNHLIIVETDSLAYHYQNYNSSPYSDYHNLSYLNNVDRLYYLLWGGTNGRFYSDSTVKNVLDLFIGSVVHSDWIAYAKLASVVGTHETDSVEIIFNTTNMSEGFYNHEIAILSNDPESPITYIPVQLEVIANKKPIIANNLQDTTLYIGQNDFNIDLNYVFVDPENDSLSYQAVSSNNSIAVCNINHTSLSFSLQGKGVTIIEVTATDAYNNSISTSFILTIKENLPPVITREISDTETHITIKSLTFNLDEIFDDPEGFPLEYSVKASSDLICGYVLENNNLIISPKSIGEASISITAIDNSKESASTSFTLVVLDNNAPELIMQKNDTVVFLQDLFMKIYLNSLFQDKDNDELTYQVASSDESVSSLIISDDILYVQYHKEGIAIITITASDKKSTNVAATGFGLIIQLKTATDRVLSDKINVYPIPAQDFLSLDLSEIQKSESITIKIFSNTGEIILQEIGKGETINKFDISGLQAGIYLLAITVGEKNQVQTIVLEK